MFIGHSDSIQISDVVGKMAMDEGSRSLLCDEARIYRLLSHLQGTSVPMVYGLFLGVDFDILLMTYAGKAVTSFSCLSQDQWCVVSTWELRHSP